MATSSILNSVLSATSGTNSNGIDVASAVSTILYADRAPERTWQAQQATLATQTSALNQLEVEASTLTDTISALQDSGGALSSVAALSSNTGVFSATAQPGTVLGNHSIVVDNIATTGAWYSQSEPSSSTPLAAGTSFALTANGTTTTIQTGNGVNTLDQLATYINGQSLGVKASVVNDLSGARLSLVATQSGSAANFSISQETGLTFTSSSTGADALLHIDGVPVTSASNTVTGAIQGVSLSLIGASSGAAVTLALQPDTASVTRTLSDFVNAYNALIKDVNTQFSYNSVAKTAGPLSADSVIQGLQSALLNSTNYNSGSGPYRTLASVGIATNQDGTLSLNSATLSAAATSNFSAVTTLFQGTASDGFGSALASALATYTNPSEGAFTVDLSSISSENKALANQVSTLELYLGTEQTRLTAEYNKADIALQQLPQKLKQINALLNPNSSGTNG